MKVHFVDLRGSFHVEREFMKQEFAARGHEMVGVHQANAAYPHLEGMPTFSGLAGPFPDWNNGARYETFSAFHSLST